MYDTDSIHEEMLENIAGSYQKTVGFPTYDLTRAAAIIAEALFSSADEVKEKINVDNLTGDELTRFVYQRKGIERKSATYAAVTLSVTGNGTLPAGSLFESDGGIQFETISEAEVSGTADVNAQCTSFGAVGNVGAGSITKIPVTIAGITAVTNTASAIDGYDEETDESLRERYYEALQKPATSGNIYHYEQWAKSISGVGGAKVFPLWNGANTVQIVIIDENKEPASSQTVAKVQEYIDPESAGTGGGEAPIGAYCTVTSAAGLDINVSVNITLLSGYTIDSVSSEIKVNIKEYLKGIAFDADYVSYAKIGNVILETDGVKDYDTLKINNGTGNITIPEKSVAVIGTVSANG